MSEIVVRLIPPDPGQVPGAPERAAAAALLRERLPSGSGALHEELGAAVRFIDAGENFEEIDCPACGKPVEIDWWGEAMARAAGTGYEELSVEVPCCRAATSLNALRYEWPQGFARWVLEVRNPGLTREDLEAIAAELEPLLGFRPRVIWALA